jgi:hypothetical protein
MGTGCFLGAIGGGVSNHRRARSTESGRISVAWCLISSIFVAMCLSGGVRSRSRYRCHDRCELLEGSPVHFM